jgi:DNA-binding response OmpR family regulator
MNVDDESDSGRPLEPITPSPSYGALVTVPVWAVRSRSLILGDFAETVSVALVSSGDRVASSAVDGPRLTLFRRELKAQVGSGLIPLTTQEFLVLEQLVLSPGVLFTVDDLRVVISDGCRLVSCGRVREVIHHVRRALGEPIRQHISTIHGRGYTWHEAERIRDLDRGPQCA